MEWYEILWHVGAYAACLMVPILAIYAVHLCREDWRNG